MATRKPRLTKTEALRQARSSTLVREYEQKQEAARQPRPSLAEPPGRRRRYTPAEPKKVEFTRPGMTKSMLARIKHAERFKQELERKEAKPTGRVPKRTLAPVGGDPRWTLKIMHGFRRMLLQLGIPETFNVASWNNHKGFFPNTRLKYVL